jgi:hypothetical protein
MDILDPWSVILGQSESDPTRIFRDNFGYGTNDITLSNIAMQGVKNIKVIGGIRKCVNI